MIINHNISAMQAQNAMYSNQASSSKNMEKLSSGLRINRASDDAAGLTISEKMRAQIRGLEQGSRNAQDSISLIQTAEGGMNETHSILQRMRELSVQASNETNTTQDTKEIQKELTALTDEIDRISTDTEFNNKKVISGDYSAKLSGAITNAGNVTSVSGSSGLADGAKFDITETVTHASESGTGNADGAFQSIDINVYDEGGSTSLATASFSKAEIDAGTISKEIELSSGGKMTIGIDGSVSASTGNGAVAETSADTLTSDNKSLSFHVGANANQTIKVDISDLSSSALKVDNLDLTTTDGAEAAITSIDNAINAVSAERSKLGAVTNRLEHSINTMSTTSENISAAESRIRDVDMAKEMMDFTKNNILTQASQAMLAQANQQPNAVLQLLR